MISTQNLEQFLDFPSTDDHYYKNLNQELPIGCANGLAYLDEGYGSVLKIQFVEKAFMQTESSSEDSKNEGAAISDKVSFTGRLGETMRESVEVVKIAVFNFLKKNPQLNNNDYNPSKSHFHLHVPQGAIPKDGPSAGVSLFVALTSIAISRPVIANIALTGEISTLGEVISIGGVDSLVKLWKWIENSEFWVLSGPPSL